MLFRKVKYEKFYEGACEQLKKDQDGFMKSMEIDSYDRWDYDEPSGVFTFSSKNKALHFDYQCLGSLSKTSNTWLWAWENNFLYPGVKDLANKVFEFGTKKNYSKLTTPKWEANETDGWDMLAVAHKIQKSIGYHRLPLDNLSLFVAFTKVLSDADVKQRKENAPRLVECGNHGLKRPAFVCQHLNKNQITGFHEAFDSSPSMELEQDDDFQAWCNECETIRAEKGEWNDRSEGYAKIKLICESCFFEIKEKNKTTYNIV